MGFTYEDLINLTWREYDYYKIGYVRRLERNWDYTRQLIANMYNSSGFTKKKVNAIDVMKLPHIDKIEPFKMIEKDRLKKIIESING